jgi:dephospho-CoA kinase
MLIIGLTGGIGSGKSAAGSRFEALDIPVIDADQVGRELCEPGQAAFEQIVSTFGKGLLDEDGRINRSLLRNRVFSNPQVRKQLEAILHPLIREAMQQQSKQFDSPYCIFMIPLLTETDQQDDVDRTLVIDTSEELQLKRTEGRDNISPSQIRDIMNAQASRKTRLSFADDVIHNIGDLSALYAAVDRLDRKYRQLVSRGSPNQNTDAGATSKPADNTVSARQSSTAQPAWLEKYLMTDNLTVSAETPFTFELPLQERSRTFLRLENLFKEFHHCLQEDSVWNTRNAVRLLLAIQQVFQHRPDTKTEMIKECDRIYALFGRYTDNSQINTEKLINVREKLKETATALRAQSGKPGEVLRKNDLICQLKQKENVPGGPTALDLPCYGHWLRSPHEQRLQDLRSWFKEFEPLETGINLLLSIIRESAVASEEVAKGGFYQASLETGSYHHMIRVQLDENEDFCTEISGGQHRFTIHFLQPNGTSRPLPAKKDIRFHLSCCAL